MSDSDEVTDLIKAVERIATAQLRSQQDIDILHRVLWTGTNGNPPLSQRITRIEESQIALHKGQADLKEELEKLMELCQRQQTKNSARLWDLSKIGISSVVGVMTTLLVLAAQGKLG